MIATFFTYIFHDTFTVLKVFSKQNEPEQKSLQTAVFFLLICYSYTVFVLDSTNEPNCDLQKKVSVKTPRNKRCELKKNFQEQPFVL